MTTLPVFDQVIFDVVKENEEKVEIKLECDILYYFGELRTGAITHYRDTLEKVAGRPGKRDALGVCLTTPGGQAEAVEKMVEIARHHYQYVYAIVPSMALSAGTIFCMACDKIYMDYSSSLGPIDPQVPDREDRFLVPALGYLA